MLTVGRKQTLAKKVKFVADIEEAIKGSISNIEALKYEVYEHMSQNWVQEYLILTFAGGAISVRNCNGTNCTGILKAIGDLADGGYYDEVRFYEELQTRSDFTLLDL